MVTADLIAYGVAELNTAGVPDCITDVHLLLCHCLQKSRTGLLLAAREEVPEEAKRQFLSLLARRSRREPLAYILGVQEFWSREFMVSPAVLIPRPETEFMLAEVLGQVRRDGGLADGMIVDLCCGSGVIGIILAIELARAVTAVDLSADALAVTRANCLRHGVADRVHLVRSDLCTGLAGRGQCGLIVSNPPYVSRAALLEELEPEVRDHEPWLALDGGDRGLDIIRRIRREVHCLLMVGGLFFMEIGHDQGDAVLELFSFVQDGEAGFAEVRLFKDYAGRDRVLMARR